MKHKLTFVLILAFIGISSSFVDAQTSSNYDWKTGNQYSTNKIGKTTHQRGYNTRTGSTWNSTTRGSKTTGNDSKGNYYNYDAKSGNYYNYGTGKSCYGKGTYRTCN